MIKRAKLINRGSYQAVLLAEEFHSDATEVYIYKEGVDVILTPRLKSWESFFASQKRPTDDFMMTRVDFEAESDLAWLCRPNSHW